MVMANVPAPILEANSPQRQQHCATYRPADEAAEEQ